MDKKHLFQNDLRKSSIPRNVDIFGYTYVWAKNDFFRSDLKKLLFTQNFDNKGSIQNL